MKRSVLLAALAAILLPVTTHAAGFLHADGKEIVDGDDHKILLRGMGLGGWMVQEGYMLQLGDVPQYVIKGKITDLIGPEKTKAFYAAWLRNDVTKADVDALGAWGFNSVRLPMHYGLFTLPVEDEPVKGQNTWLEPGFTAVDNLLTWAQANNMYVILDMHAAPGGQGRDLPISDRDPSRPSLWESPADQDKLVALWRKIAERYANNPSVGGYDILNEPNWGFENPKDERGCGDGKNVPLRDLYMRITKAIREVDQHHMIIIEGNCWGNNYNGVLPAWDSNMALSLHKYWNDTGTGAISPQLALREQYNIPLWMGESGENGNTWFADAIKTSEDNDIGWSWWPLKKFGFNNPLQISPNGGFARISAYWQGKGPRPSERDAERALMTLAGHDIRFENNILHKDVVDALIRLPQNDSARPFKDNVIGPKGGTIQAVDYDMGRNGVAYFDTVAATYHQSTGGPRTPWNDGETYRNDGVDIQRDPAETPYVTNMETGEWMQYTIRAERAGRYRLRLRAASAATDSVLSVRLNGEDVSTDIVLNTSHDKVSPAWRSVSVATLYLQSGRNTFVIKAEKGNLDLANLSLAGLH